MPLLPKEMNDSSESKNKKDYQTVLDQDNKLVVNEMSRCKQLSYQLGMFSLCYLAWVCVHM